jgi:hypothetical protein
MPWNTAPKLDDEWKVDVAANMLKSLSESKLIVCFFLNFVPKLTQIDLKILLNIV